MRTEKERERERERERKAKSVNARYSKTRETRGLGSLPDPELCLFLFFLSLFLRGDDQSAGISEGKQVS